MRGSIASFLFPLRPQIVFGGGETGSANSSSNDNDSGSGNSISESIANFFTPNDGMSYVDGVLVNDSDGSKVDIPAASTSSPAVTSNDDNDNNSGGGGYTSLTDMFDGGGPGQSGDTFGGALGGISNALGATPLDSGIEPTGPAAVVNDLIGSATNYDDFSDMIDGGGPGASDDDFGGLLGGISNTIGMEPVGSSEEPSGIASLMGDAVVGGVNTIGNVVGSGSGPTDSTSSPPPLIDIFEDSSPSPIIDTELAVEEPVIEEPVIEDNTVTRVGVATTPTFSSYNPVVSGGAMSGYTPSESLMRMQNFYDSSARMNSENSPFLPVSYVPPEVTLPVMPPITELPKTATLDMPMPGVSIASILGNQGKFFV